MLITRSFTRASSGVFVLVDFAPFLDRISDASTDTMRKLDLGVAAMLQAKVFIVSALAHIHILHAHGLIVVASLETDQPYGGPYSNEV
jgi:hypothetical protein